MSSPHTRWLLEALILLLVIAFAAFILYGRRDEPEEQESSTEVDKDIFP